MSGILGPGDKQTAYEKLLPISLREKFVSANLNSEYLQEIRLRTRAPLLLLYSGKEYTLLQDGTLSEKLEFGYRITPQDIKNTMEQVTGYSLYAFEQEIKQGFITVEGGHRVGLAGKVVYEDHQIRYIREFSGLNIRLSHQKQGCARQLLPFLVNGNALYHTLLLSSPGGGKTTMLRDLIRLISDGTEFFPGKKVGVVDERSELAGMYHGIAQNNLGIRTDVLDGCPKHIGMVLLLRSMSPQIIAVDELGSERDLEAVQNVFYCGCKLLATAHGHSMEDIKKNPMLGTLLQMQMFERYVLLGDSGEPGRIRMILDAEGEVIKRED